MLTLQDVLRRNMEPGPWQEGERVPWDDPAFSQRVLQEHLAQDNEAASRPNSKIKQHVAWIHKQLLGGQPAKILDLGCGPGLYTARLAKLGHTCTGIDFAPAAIHYALKNAPKGCAYQLADMRAAEYGAGYDLVMYIFGALNLLPRADALRVLEKACQALKPGGTLLLEVSSLDSVDQIGNQPAMWYSAESGLFSDRPHLCLMETFWDEEQLTATERFYIIDALSGQVTHHAASTQAYEEEGLEELLAQAGFEQVTFHPSMSGGEEEEVNDFWVLTAKGRP